MNHLAELEWTTPCQFRDEGPHVLRVQEWLCLQGFSVVIDGDYGPATRRALRAFLHRQRLTPTETVDAAVFAELCAPLRRAIAKCPIDAAAPPTLGQRVLAVAKQHLAEQPREVGGSNCGPWVRYYMRGYQGAAWPWCAGFVSAIVHQAAADLGQTPPLPYIVSCDRLAKAAKERKCWHDFGVASPSQMRANNDCAWIFLVRRQAGDWTHVGFAHDFDDDGFATIEGNTNDSGSREGYEACPRTRSYRSIDLIRL